MRDRCQHRRAGFTMVEIVMTIAIVAVMFVAVLNTVGSSRTTLLKVGQRAAAASLAQDLLQEILAQPYRDPNHPASFGPTGAEAATGDRSLFNDVDDYHSWSASPPVDRYGNALPGAEQLTRAVQVHWVNPADLTPQQTDTGLKRITVQVKRNDTLLAEFVAFRSESLRLEPTP